MKYFSLSYNLSASDYNEYDKIYNMDLVKSYLRRMIPITIIFLVAAFIDWKTSLFYLLFVLSSFVSTPLINKEFSKVRAESIHLKKTMTVEFYDNHIVTRLLPDGSFKSHTEKHYGFDKINRILESDGSFYFIFKDNSLLVIPKKYINEEQYTMIKNLIENLFISKYFYLQTKN